MLYSWDVLRRFINIDDDIENIQKNLTLKSCEVEEYTVREIPKDVVIWKASKVEKHPDADKLVVCQVDCWDKWQFQIVTGWENMTADRYVPVAVPWSYLPVIDLKISSRKMRWFDSSGMICSKWELWINLDLESHNIWLLDEDLEGITDSDLWLALTDKFPYLDNFIIDVDNKTLTNRPDMTGHFGLSIDLNAIYSSLDWNIRYNKLSQILNDWSNTNIFDVLDNSDRSDKKVEILSDNVRSYIALSINWVNIKDSDFLLSLYLSDLWQGLVNNWVDFSNYFMNLSGNPIHFFDADKIEWNIKVRQAKSWEKFVDLFEKEHELDENDLVIADDTKILALAGIVWSIDSWVTSETKNIVAEIANFDPVCIRKTWTKLWLRTDAELRFEKNISPIYSLYTLLLFLDEISHFSKSLWDFTIKWLDYFANDEAKNLLNKTVDLDFSKIQYFIFGEEIDWFTDKSKDILSNLWFEIFDSSVKVPIWRSPQDINIKEDLYEEVIRIYWYENISEKKLEWDVKDNWWGSDTWLIRNIEDSLINMNFVNVETYPWVDVSLLSKFEVDLDNLVKLENPVASELENLRDSMVYNMLNVIQKNFRVYDYIKIFDIWKVWSLSQDWYPNELDRLNFMIYNRSKSNWYDDTILEIKSVLNNLFKDINLKWKLDFNPTHDKRSHPKKQARIVFNGKDIWWIASLHPAYYEYFKFPETCEISYVEIDFTNLQWLLEKQWSNFSWIDYHTVQDNIFQKDISFVIDKSKSFGQISDSLSKIKNVIDVELYDVYVWTPLSENEKSFTLRLTIDARDYEWDVVSDVFSSAISSAEKLWAKLRE